MKRSLAVSILTQIAVEAGLTVEPEPVYGHTAIITLPNGRIWPIRDWHLGLNTQAAARLARDKAFSRYFLRRAGWPVPESAAFYADHWARAIGSSRNIDQALTYAKGLGWPVIVKPNTGSGGRLVYEVKTATDFKRMTRKILVEDKIMLVERPVRGREFRIIVFDNKLLLAYEKVTDPNHLTADRSGPIQSALNLHAGGRVVGPVIDIHPDHYRSFTQMAADLGLRWAGLDIIADADLAAPTTRFWILEANAAPAFDYYAAWDGHKRRTVSALLETILKTVIEENGSSPAKGV